MSARALCALLVALAAGLAIGSTGCAQIFGIDDANEVPAPSDGAADVTHVDDAATRDATSRDDGSADSENDAATDKEGNGAETGAETEAADGAERDGSGEGSRDAETGGPKDAEDEMDVSDDSGACGGGCLGGKICLAGACQCPPGKEDTCGTQCVDLDDDSSNCGTCAHSCFGGTCSASACSPVVFVAAALTSTIVDIASDGTVVVWADVGNNTIDQVSTAGGSVTVLASGATAGLPVSNPRGIAINTSGSVWWLQYGTESELGHATRGTANTDKLIVSFRGITYGLVTNDLDGAYTVDYFAGFGAQGMSCGMLGCGTDGVLVSTATQTSLTVGVDENTGIAFADITDSEVIEEATVIAGQPNANYVTDDGVYAYWSTSSGTLNQIRRAALGTATVETVANAGEPVVGIATDGTYVYFAAGTSIYFVPASGGSAALLAKYAGNHLKYVAGALYFDVGGAIYKVATP